MQSNNLTRITGMNVKGRTFNHALAPLTVLTGENATGKSAVTDAITVAVLGYHPALGRKAGATMALAPDAARQMEIEAAFSDGTRIRRTFTRTKTGAGLDTIGTAPEINPTQLAFSEFIAAKPTERHAILTTMMGEIPFSTISDATTAKAASLGLPASYARINAEADSPLEDAIGRLATEAKEIRQSVDLNRKTIATLGAEATALPDPVAAELITQAEQRYAQANQAIGAASQAFDQIAFKQQQAPDEPMSERPTPEELEEAADAVRAAETAATEAKAQRAHRQAIKESIGYLQAQINRHATLADLAVGTPPEKTRETIKAEHQALQERYAALTAEVNENSGKIGATKADVFTIRRQLDEIGTSGRCPCCGTEGQALEAAMAAMVTRARKAEQDAKDASERAEATNLKIADLAKQQTALAATLVQIDAHEAKAEREALQAKLTEAETTLAGMPDDYLTLANQASAAATALTRLQLRRADWEQYDHYEAPTAEQVESAKQAYNAAKIEASDAADAMNALRAKRTAYEAAVEDQRRIATMIAEADKAEETREAIITLREFLVGQQRDAAAAAIKPLLDVAGIFLGGLLQGTMAVRGHQVGIERGDQFLPVEVLSGMETVAVAAAFQAAQASTAALPILIVDEMARMTVGNRARFARNCNDAIALGIISQAILIDQTAEAYPDATVIACG